MTPIVALADTHTAVWYLLKDPRLSELARATILDAAANRSKVAISSISLVEMMYLVDKVRLPISAYDELKQALNSPTHVFTEAVLNAEIAQAMWQIPRDEVPDMPDRIVAATALHLGVPVMSRDRRIRSASLSTIW